MDVIDAIVIRNAVMATLQAHMPTVVADRAAAHGLDVEPPPADAYHALNRIDDLNALEPRSTAAAVVVPDEQYVYLGDEVHGDFQIVVAFHTRGSDATDTLNRVDVLRSSARIVLDQHRGLGDHPFYDGPLASHLLLGSSSYRPIAGASRLLLQGLVVAAVRSGPTHPRFPSLSADGDDIATTVDLTATQED